MTEQLVNDALDFLAEVEAAAVEEGRKAAQADCDARIVREREEWYNKGYADCERDKEASADAPAPEPPQPADGFDGDKAVQGLLALKGSKSYAFGFVTPDGSVYALADWKWGGSVPLLGIGYTDGTHHLCMHIKKVGAKPFGGSGVTFGKKVYTTTKQWRQGDARIVPAYDDFTGASNTEGIIEACADALAAKCRAVVFENGRSGYMPACGELRVFCKHFPEVDKMLDAVGGDPLKTQNGAQIMWSSTCRDKDNAWTVRYMSEGDAQPAYRAKTSSISTRAFVKL